MSIAELLKKPLMRGGNAPFFQAIDLPSIEDRKKRVRYWTGSPDGCMVLPWISLNPSGKRDDGRGPTGVRIANFAWKWGFDGVSVYNVYPFPASKPKDIKLRIVEWRKRGDAAVGEAIVANHLYIADALRGNDAAIVAWGALSGPFGAETIRWVKELVKVIDSADRSRHRAFETWCLGTTEKGHPRHPSPLGQVPADTRPQQIFL